MSTAPWERAPLTVPDGALRDDSVDGAVKEDSVEGAILCTRDSVDGSFENVEDDDDVDDDDAGKLLRT